ncbi:MAG: hypothetical protein ACRDAQ_07855 [Cetobacterium sp.]
MKILIKDVLNRVIISEDIIKRLKGLKTLSHALKENKSIQNIKNGRLENPLLSSHKKYLYLEDLKKLILYSLVRTRKSIIKDVALTQDRLRKDDIDSIISKLILSQNKKFKLTKDKIINGLDIESCLKVLEELYPKNMDVIYTIDDMLAPEVITNEYYEIKNMKSKKIINSEKKQEFEVGNNILEYIFEKYSKELNGYFPLQHPTGNGKTFHLENFIVKNIIDNFTDLKHDRIIIITNNKININEIYRGIFSKLKAQSEESKKECIFQMRSVSDILNDTQFLDEILNDLNKDLKFYNLFQFKESFLRKFKEKIRLLKEHVNKKSPLNSNDFLKEHITEVKKCMFKAFHLKEKNEIYYKDMEIPNFLYKLFPMIIEENLQKKIFIMTTDKFLYGYVGKEGTEYFYEDFKNSLIFIDEIDSAKDKFLDFIKNRRTLNIQNIIDVFNDRYNFFSEVQNNQLNTLIEKLSKFESTKDDSDKKNIKKRKAKLQEKMKFFMSKGKVLREKYFTTTKYFELENETRIDLFENENHYVQSDRKKFYIDITHDSCLITERKTSLELTELIDDLFEYSYNKFYNLLNEVYDYHMLLKEDNEVEKEIISHFVYNLESQKEMLSEYKNYYIQKIKILQDNRNFMDKEYSYIQISEINPDYKTNKKVRIKCQYMYITPEDFLYSICKNNFVFGISATANIDTCIGNFDIKWLKSRLKNNYFQMTNLEKKALKKALLKINNFEKNIERELSVFRDNSILLTDQSKGFHNINTFLKDSKKCKLQKIVQNIFNDALESVNDKLDENQINFQKNCISYAVTVFLNFLLDEDTSSLLFLSNRFTHKDILKKTALELGKHLKKKVYFNAYKSKELDEVLKNSNEEENELMNNLKDYKTKTIIFTSYQSAGVGVNIKHTYSKRLDNKLIKLNEDIQKETGISLRYKDIDEIALENKTNIVSFEDLFNEKIILLYYTNLLLRNKALTKRERSLLLNRFNDIDFKKVYKKRYDYTENIVGKIIQGIGRCNRTKVRCKKRNIYLDNDSFEVIKKFKDADRLFIEDFNFLLAEAFKEEGAGKNNFQLEILRRDNEVRRYFENTYLDEISAYNQGIRNIDDKNKKLDYINNFMKFYKQYERFRMYVLKNPTRGFQETESVAYFSPMERIDNYTVLGSAGDKVDNILFNTTNGNVSKKDSRLDELKSIPLLKDTLENKVGLFTKNNEIILPYIYQAIFKGTLGEVLIKEIFRIYDIRLKNIDDILSMGMLEIFDDISENGMCIDYKNYNLEKINSREFFNDIIIDKVIQKRKYITSDKKLFIINLISNKLKESNTDIAFYKLQDIYNENYKTCEYEECELVVVSGILRYRENNEKLEINESLMRELKNMLEEK